MAAAAAAVERLLLSTAGLLLLEAVSTKGIKVFHFVISQWFSPSLIKEGQRRAFAHNEDTVHLHGRQVLNHWENQPNFW